MARISRATLFIASDLDSAAAHDLLSAFRTATKAGAPSIALLRSMARVVATHDFVDVPPFACVVPDDDQVHAIVYGDLQARVRTSRTEELLDASYALTWMDRRIDGALVDVAVGDVPDVNRAWYVTEGVVPASGALICTAELEGAEPADTASARAGDERRPAVPPAAAPTAEVPEALDAPEVPVPAAVEPPAAVGPPAIAAPTARERDPEPRRGDSAAPAPAPARAALVTPPVSAFRDSAPNRFGEEDPFVTGRRTADLAPSTPDAPGRPAPRPSVGEPRADAPQPLAPRTEPPRAEPPRAEPPRAEPRVAPQPRADAPAAQPRAEAPAPAPVIDLDQHRTPIESVPPPPSPGGADPLSRNPGVVAIPPPPPPPLPNAAPAPAPADAGPFGPRGLTLLTSEVRMVAGVQCQLGHLNRPDSLRCQFCDAPLDRAAGTVVGPRPALGALSFDDTGERVPLVRPVVVGSAPPDELVIAGEDAATVTVARDGISDIHFEVHLDSWDAFVIDRSIDGTYIDDAAGRRQRLPRHARVKLKPGTVVVFGPCRVRYEELAPPTS